MQASDNIGQSGQDNKLSPSAIVDRVSHIFGIERQRIMLISTRSRGNEALARYVCWHILRDHMEIQTINVAELFRVSPYVVRRGIRALLARPHLQRRIDEIAEQVFDDGPFEQRAPLEDMAGWSERVCKAPVAGPRPDRPRIKGCPHKAFSDALKGASFESYTVPRGTPRRISPSLSQPWGGSSAATCAEMGDG